MKRGAPPAAQHQDRDRDRKRERGAEAPAPPRGSDAKASSPRSAPATSKPPAPPARAKQPAPTQSAAPATLRTKPSAPPPSSAPAPQHIPGYYWDAEKRRYFKGKPPAPSLPPLVAPPPSLLPPRPSSVALLHARQCTARPSPPLRALPLQYMQRYSCALPALCTGEIRSSFAQESPDSLLVAIAQNGACVARIRWASETRKLSVRPIAGCAMGAMLTAARWNPVHTDILATAAFGEADTPGEWALHKVTAETLASEAAHRERRGSLWTLEWHPQGERLAIGRSGCGAVVTESGRFLTSLKTSGSDVFAVAFTASGNVVLHGDRQGLIRSHDLRCPDSELRYGSHLPIIQLRSSVCSMQLLRDPHYLLTSGLKNELTLWDRRTQRTVATYADHVTSLARLAAALDPTQGYVAAYGSDACLRVWDIRGGAPLRELRAANALAAPRPQWVDHWCAPALLAADGTVSYYST